VATRSLGTLTIDVLARTANLTQGMSKAAREVDNEAKRIRRSLESNVAQGANTASDALNRFGAQVVSIAAAWRGLSAGIAAADTWTNLNNRLRLVTDGQAQFVAAQENVLRIAKETRQPLEATAELYQRIATNQKELGLSGQGVADIVETISKAMVVSGTSAQGAQAALVQLGQAFASGTLRGEELNSVLEQAPALANAIAAGLGVPIGKLRELGKAGELTAEQVIGALQDQADEIDAAFGKMDTTIGQALTNVRTNLTEIIGRFSEATGAASGLASAINFLGNNLPQVAAAFAAFASVKLTQQLGDRVRASVRRRLRLSRRQRRSLQTLRLSS
jgi:tape measure domain